MMSCRSCKGLGYLLLLVLSACAAAEEEPPPPPPPPSAEPEKPVPPPVPEGAVVLADFEKGDVNAFGEPLEPWHSAAPDPEGICIEEPVAGAGVAGSAAWRIDYDITPQGSYAGSITPFKGLITAGYKSISFAVRSEGTGPIDFILELKTGEGDKIRAGRFVVRSVGDAWQTVRVPLQAFALPPQPITFMATVFDPQTTRVRKGRIYLDDVRLLRE